eukprot:413697_1
MGNAAATNQTDVTESHSESLKQLKHPKFSDCASYSCTSDTMSCTPSKTASTSSTCKQLTIDSTPYISNKIIKTAAHFWTTMIDTLSYEDQLEIGVSIYLSMTIKDAS